MNRLSIAKRQVAHSPPYLGLCPVHRGFIAMSGFSDMVAGCRVPGAPSFHSLIVKGWESTNSDQHVSDA
jgi:hypothetical protein